MNKKNTVSGMSLKLTEFNKITDTCGAESFIKLLLQRTYQVKLYLYVTGENKVCFWSDWFGFDLQFSGSCFKFKAWWRGEPILKQGDKIEELNICSEFWEILKRISELEAADDE